MKSFQEFISEAKSGTMEIPTTKAKEYEKELKSKGFEVSKADDEGLVVKGDMDKLHKWMETKGWDKEDIKAMHS